MDRTRASLLLALAALAAGCAATPELTGAAAARSLGADVGGGDAPAAPEAGPDAAARPYDPFQDDERKLATVNGTVIILRQVRHAIGPQHYDALLSDRADLATLVNARLRDLVLRRLMVDEGKRIGLSVADDEMEEREALLAKEGAKKGDTIDQMVRDMGMTRREWDAEQRDRILNARTEYYMLGAAPDAAYGEDRFRPAVDSYVAPGEIREWGARNPGAIDRPGSVWLRILYLAPEDFSGDGVTEEEAARRCGAALDSLLARAAAGEPFGKIAGEGHRYPGAGEGGLVGPILRDSPFPAQFKEWAFAPGRKAGDLSERMTRGPGTLVLRLERSEAAVHPDIEEWGPAVRSRIEDLRSDLARLEIRIRLLQSGTVSPPGLRAALLAELRAEARSLRETLEPPDPPRTAAAPER